MSTMFERFAKMAREEFGLTVVETANRTTTFESLFGFSPEKLFQSDLPYCIPSVQAGYYNKEAAETEGLKANWFETEFDTNDNLYLAA